MRPAGNVRFRLAEFKDPASGATHTDFSVRLSGTCGSPNVMVGMKWRDRYNMGGGYPEDPEGGYLKFADKPATAPIVWVDGDDPFRFQRWYSDKLSMGGADDLKVFVGQPGRGRSSFFAHQDHYLPESEGVQATLISRDLQDASAAPVRAEGALLRDAVSRPSSGPRRRTSRQGDRPRGVSRGGEPEIAAHGYRSRAGRVQHGEVSWLRAESKRSI